MKLEVINERFQSNCIYLDQCAAVCAERGYFESVQPDRLKIWKLSTKARWRCTAVHCNRKYSNYRRNSEGTAIRGYFNKNNTARLSLRCRPPSKAPFGAIRMDQDVGFIADQQKRMDDIFQQYRLKLIDLTAALQKEELILEPLFSGKHASRARSRIKDSDANRPHRGRPGGVGEGQFQNAGRHSPGTHAGPWGKLPMPPK
jgi:hypothetical protein